MRKMVFLALMGIVAKRTSLLGFSMKPIFLFVLFAICVACNSSNDILNREESSAEKAVYIDSLFAIYSKPTEFVKATAGETGPNFKKAQNLLKNDEANNSLAMWWRSRCRRTRFAVGRCLI